MTVSTKSQAVKFASTHLQQQGIAYARCLGAVKIPLTQTELWRSVIPGIPQLIEFLWQVNFEKEVLPSNVVDTGNSFSVFVDSASGACGIFWSM